VKHITKAALGGLAGCGLILAATLTASGESADTRQVYTGALIDLDTDDTDLYLTTGAFDTARAKVTIAESAESTMLSIKVTGIDASASGRLIGAHLHVGKCAEGVPGSALGHYNNQMVPAGTLTSYSLAEKNPRTEAWFDIVPDKEDNAASFQTTVPFVPKDVDGHMSIVLHVDPTAEITGAAGNREACFPLSVPQWIPQSASTE
jgi:Cu/Zn superoxide dismutase